MSPETDGGGSFDRLNDKAKQVAGSVLDDKNRAECDSTTGS